jgi:hypothetical protein
LGQNHEESGEENSHVESFDGTLKDRDENREYIDEPQFSTPQCVITTHEWRHNLVSNRLSQANLVRTHAQQKWRPTAAISFVPNGTHVSQIQ